MKSRKLGHFLLLEVLIAFALVVMAVLPLIYPHIYIYQQQRAFINKIDLDIAVNQIYVNLAEKLHRNEIPWGDIEHKRVAAIDTKLLEGTAFEKSFPFEGTYQFEIARRKKNPQYALNLVKLTIDFKPKSLSKSSKEEEVKSLVYTYEVFIAQMLNPSANPDATPPATPEAKKP